MENTIKCELFFGNKDVGGMEDAQLNINSGLVVIEHIFTNHLTAPQKWIEFTYQGQDFKVDVHVRDGKIKVKNKKDLSAIELHMKLENILVESLITAKKMKI